MSLRESLIGLFAASERTFREDAPTCLRGNDLDPARVDRSVDDGLAVFEESVDTELLSGLNAYERELLWRLWVFDDAPLGVTISGPAYQDNPLLGANRTFRSLTGYSMKDLLGENPRILQGAETESAAVSDLSEAIEIWERVTVTLTNYRWDDTTFRNRVSIVPLEDGSGMITNWLGVQQAVND